MIFAAKLGAKIEAYLSGQITLQELRSWFTSIETYIERSGETKAADFAYAISKALTQLDGGAITEAQFKTTLTMWTVHVTWTSNLD